MSSPTEENSLSPNPNKSLDGDIIFVGDYINLNKTSDAVVDLTKDPLEKGKLITQSPSGDDAKQNLVDGEGKEVADTLSPYKLPYSATRLPRSLNTFESEMKLTTAVTKREKWLRDGNKWDDIVPDRDLPTNIKYIVVDVETHDWKYRSSRDGRIVEIAWMVFDCDMKCLESKQYLLEPHGYDKIAQKATAVHGITTELAVEYGVDSHLVFDEFIAIVKQLPNNGFVIAHNMKHEDPIFKRNLNKEQQVQWGDAPKCDTCDVKLLKYLPTSACEKYKTRTLGVNLVELYGVVHPTKDDNCVNSWHMAMADVKMTWAIFLYYVTSVSYNEIKWKNDSKVKPKPMIPAYKTYERSVQKRKFNGC